MEKPHNKSSVSAQDIFSSTSNINPAVHMSLLRLQQSSSVPTNKSSGSTMTKTKISSTMVPFPSHPAKNKPSVLSTLAHRAPVICNDAKLDMHQKTFHKNSYKQTHYAHNLPFLKYHINFHVKTHFSDLLMLPVLLLFHRNQQQNSSPLDLLPKQPNIPNI